MCVPVCTCVCTARVSVRCSGGPSAESIGEEIKKEIVSSRCFKLPFITTHKPDLGFFVLRREVLPAAILSHPPTRAGSREDRGGGCEGSRVENTVYIIVFCSPQPSRRPPASTPPPTFLPGTMVFLRLYRPLFLMESAGLCLSLAFSPSVLHLCDLCPSFFRGSYISVPCVGLKPSVMIITSGIVTSEHREPALRLQEMATDNVVTAIFIL